MKSNTTILLFTTLIILIISSCLKEEDFRTWEDERKELQEYLDTNNITTQPTWTGLYYIETEAGNGIIPEFLDTVVIEYKATLLDGSFLASSEDDGEPLIFKLMDSLIYGVNEAISYMKEGAKAKVIIPSFLAYGDTKINNIEPYSTLVYDIELKEVRPGILVEPFYTDTLSLNTTSSGLQYYIVEEDTTASKVKNWDDIKLHYTGYLENGRIFYSSVKRNETSTFQIGAGELIRGLDEGIVLMREGEKFRFIIPPDLAYGVAGIYPIIPPNETLVYDVEVIEIL